MSATKKTIHETLYDNLVNATEELWAAEEAAQKARERLGDIWRKHLAWLDDVEGADHPIQHERVIVQDEKKLYEIKFDIDEFAAPEVSRIDRYVGVHRTGR